MAHDNFLICRNCINWGQPWKLGKQVIICEKRQDVYGKYYTSLHAACRYFIPIQGFLPSDLQKLRLFIQTLNQTQQSYFAWSLSQASLLLRIRDSEGQQLVLGDQVKFRLGLLGHTGTVEGAHPQYKNVVIINAPIFIGNNISLVSSSVTRITKKEAYDLIKEDYKDAPNKAHWTIECLIKEITTLRLRQDTWTKDDHLSILLYEQQLQTIQNTHDTLSTLGTTL